MIFQHTHRQVLDGSKTQTRRLVKPGESLYYAENGVWNAVTTGKTNTNGNPRIKWQVGKTYAVQPARARKTIGRIRITGIRQEDVRCISFDDVRREGFKSKYEFLEVWTQMHDKAAYNARPDGTWQDVPLSEQHKSWRDWLAGQADERYQAWVLEFEAVAP